MKCFSRKKSRTEFQSAIRNPTLEIRHRTSDSRNPQSEIKHQTSNIGYGSLTTFNILFKTNDDQFRTGAVDRPNA